MRESRVWAVLGAAVCAFTAYQFVWSVYPTCSWCEYSHSRALFAANSLFASLLIFLWSILPLWKIETYPWVRRAIFSHIIICAAIVISVWIFRIEMLPKSLGAIKASAILGFAVGIVMAVLSPPSGAPQHAKRFYARSIAIGVGGTIAGLMAWSILNAFMLSAQAKALANGRPYCIQVAGNYLGGYAEVMSMHALSGLRMQTPFTNGGGSEDFQFAFHGVLVIEEGNGFGYLNWSYSRFRFDAISEGTRRSLGIPRPFCVPRQHFIEQLPWLSRGQT